MNQPSCICPDMLDSGNWITGYGGPVVSPYAQAIINEYDIAIPGYLTVQANLTATANERFNATSSPYQYDLLLIGAHLKGFAGSDNGQFAFMNVWDRRSLLPWVTPSPIGWAPLTAFCGVNVQPTPILKLPEAYFLPAHVELNHNFYSLTGAEIDPGTVTWVCVQLINRNGRPGPGRVTLANGTQVNIGQRQPWFAPIGLGRLTYSAGTHEWDILAGANYVSYTEPMDCDVEIHDVASAHIFEVGDSALDPDTLQFKISDMGDRDMWRPGRSPSTAVLGDFSQIYPALPFNKPYILKKGHRLQISVLNTNSTQGYTNAFIVLRGVRLCEY